jgi:hypothetical protein
VIESRYEWISYPESDPGDGLFEWEAEHVVVKARVLVNPTMMQVRNESEYFTASLGTDIDKQDAYWQYIAPRIPEWNLQYRDKKGKVVDLPAPATDWQSLLALPFNLAMWLRMSVHLAHRSKILARLQNLAVPTDSTPETSPAPQNSPA